VCRVLQILAEAHTFCKAKGGNAEYDGGCARAVAYADAYAKAQAESISIAFVDYTYGKSSHCHCDVSVEVQTKAITHELETIFAFYKTEVEARSCSEDQYGTPDIAYIKQTCWAGAFADMTVKVRARAAAIHLAITAVATAPPCNRSMRQVACTRRLSLLCLPARLVRTRCVCVRAH
jgi:hypothetical protein